MDLSAAQHQLHHHYHHHHHQDSQTLETMITSPNPGGEKQQQQQQDDKKARPAETEPQKCPRCESTNTKFCYYNNYSLAQPRYFCKSCRRYWTKGGTLRKVPVGGGCRKNKRSSAPSPSFKRAHSPHMMTSAAPFNPLSYGGGFGLGFDVMGNASVTDCEGALGHPHSGSFLGEFLANPSWNGSSNCVSGISKEMGVVPYDDLASTGGTTAVTFTAVKQENDEGRALWGFPWQIGGFDHGGLGVGADLEPMRETWNGLIGNYAPQGLLNSPALTQ